MDDPRELIRQAASDPELTMEKATIALLRGVLLGIVEGDTPKPGSTGELLKGMADLKSVGGGSDLLDMLKTFAESGDDPPALA